MGLGVGLCAKLRLWRMVNGLGLGLGALLMVWA